MCFSRESIYEKSLLDNLSADILFKHSSFYSFCQAYNFFYKIPLTKNRLLLKRIRLAETWFTYRYCKHIYEKCNSFLEKRFIQDLNQALLDLKPSLAKYFTSKWSENSHHRDKCISDCSKLYVLDGIHKINHRKCMFQEKFLKVPEIKERFQIGCNSTPACGK